LTCFGSWRPSTLRCSVTPGCKRRAIRSRAALFPWRNRVRADDPVRRTVAGVPDDIEFQTKPAIALQQMSQALAAGGHRASCWLIRRMATTAVFELGSPNLACLTRSVSCPTRQFGGPARRHCRLRRIRGRGRAAKRVRRDETHQPVSVKTLALELAADAWPADRLAGRQQYATDIAFRSTAGASGT
jgi:hypothetical protein